MKKEIEKSEFDRLFDKLNLWATNREKRKYLNTFKKYLLANFSVKTRECTLIEKEEELETKVAELANARRNIPQMVRKKFLEKINLCNAEMEKFILHKLHNSTQEENFTTKEFTIPHNKEFQNMIYRFHHLKNIIHKKSDRKNYFSFFQK